MQRKIFRPRTIEVIGDRRKLHKEELDNLYSSTNIRMIKTNRVTWEGHTARFGEKRNVHKILFGKPEGERLLGRSGCR